MPQRSVAAGKIGGVSEVTIPTYGQPQLVLALPAKAAIFLVLTAAPDPRTTFGTYWPTRAG